MPRSLVRTCPDLASTYGAHHASEQRHLPGWMKGEGWGWGGGGGGGGAAAAATAAAAAAAVARGGGHGGGGIGSLHCVSAVTIKTVKYNKPTTR